MYVLLFPILDYPSSRTPQEQWPACSARGPSEVNCPSLVRDGHVFCYFFMFFLLGFLLEGTSREHGENMQTPHRKAREIAHLSTVHSGEDLPPRARIRRIRSSGPSCCEAAVQAVQATEPPCP